MRNLLLLGLAGLVFSQVPKQTPTSRPKPTVIIPDGLIPGSKKEDHRVDLSSCDEVTVSLRLNYASITDGELTFYSFKRFGHDATITCTMVKP